MKRFIPMEMFRKNSNTFRGIIFFPFSPKRPEIFCTICLVNQCQASSWGKRWFVLTQVHSLSGVLQIVQLWPIPLFGNVFNSQYHLSETFYRNFLTNGKRSRSWFWICSAQPTIIVSPIKQLPLHHPSAKLLNFCLLKARSINNKSLQIKDNLVDKSIDILALAVTWLRANECSDFIIRDISPTGYAFVHIMPLGLVALAEALACSIEKTWKLNSWKLIF